MSDKVELKEEEVEELQKRETLTRQYQLTTDALRLQSRVFLNSILESHGLDISENYNVNLDTGEIKKVEEENEEK